MPQNDQKLRKVPCLSTLYAVLQIYVYLDNLMQSVNADMYLPILPTHYAMLKHNI